MYFLSVLDSGNADRTDPLHGKLSSLMKGLFRNTHPSSDMVHDIDIRFQDKILFVFPFLFFAEIADKVVKDRRVERVAS